MLAAGRKRAQKQRGERASQKKKVEKNSGRPSSPREKTMQTVLTKTPKKKLSEEHGYDQGKKRDCPT